MTKKMYIGGEWVSARGNASVTSTRGLRCHGISQCNRHRD